MENVENDERSWDEEAYDQERREQRKAVQEQIRKAFSKMECPGFNTLFDDLHAEDERFAEGLRGKKWQDLDPEFVDYNYCDLHILTSQGFLYYLPAWLTEALAKVGGSMVGDTVLHVLTPPPYGINTTISRFTERVEPLTLEQKRAVLAYLEYFNEGYDKPDDQYVQALTHYWRQFAESVE